MRNKKVDEEIFEKLAKCLVDIGCWVKKEEFENTTLTHQIIRILPHPYKAIVSKVWELVYDKLNTVKFTPAEEKFLREHGLAELFDDNKKV